MAVKSKTPTKLGRKQLAATMQNVFEKNAQFIPIKRAKEWFGRMDKNASEQVNVEWEAYCNSLRVHKTFWTEKTRPFPKLLIAELAKPRGYILVRADKKDEWLARL